MRWCAGAHERRLPEVKPAVWSALQSQALPRSARSGMGSIPIGRPMKGGLSGINLLQRAFRGRSRADQMGGRKKTVGRSGAEGAWYVSARGGCGVNAASNASVLEAAGG